MTIVTVFYKSKCHCFAIDNNLSKLNSLDEKPLLDVLRPHNKTFRLTLANIKVINHSYCMHKIRLEERYMFRGSAISTQAQSSNESNEKRNY